MSKEIILQVVGAPLKKGCEAETLGELIEKYQIPTSYSAFINNNPVPTANRDATELSDGDMVIFTSSVKGNSWEGAVSPNTPVVYPYAVFNSPVLNIVRISDTLYKVNGLELNYTYVFELLEDLADELEDFEPEFTDFLSSRVD